MIQAETLSARSPSLFGGLGRKVRADFLSNWRLALLGLTGFALSAASGWTTLDGMTNFTKTPVLSLMITFGIQGVMLVSAWLIGESFARGVPDDDKASGMFGDVLKKSLQLFIGMAVLLLIAFVLAKYILALDGAEIQKTLTENIFTAVSVLGGILAVALVLVLFSRTEIIGPYARGLRIILSNLPLWAMFVICMGTSVFFSFDSLFSTIFPADERQRAGSLRTQGQVAGIVADLDVRIKKRRGEAADALFASAEWKAYEAKIGRLAQIVHDAPGAIEGQIVAKLKEQQTALAVQREKLSSARSSHDSLLLEREQVKVSLQRLEAEKPKREAEVTGFENDLRAKEQDIATRQARAKAEAKGVGNTGQAGRGPKFRELNKIVTKLRIDVEALQTQLNSAKRALGVVDRRLVSERARITQIDKESSGLKSKEIAAEQNIKVQDSLNSTGSVADFDASGGLKTLEQELAKFRQQPTQSRLANVQASCGKLLLSVSGVAALQEKASGLDCDPGDANDAAGEVFALDGDVVRFQRQCGKDASVPGGDAGELLAFGQKCILVSGLPGADTQAFRTQLNRVALSRDDKAHRFVVTWNAFVDGNQLAYLALAIAVAIDSMVFMSGLFGANASVSPLAGAPRARNRSVSQLQEIIDNALLPDKAYTAELVLNMLHPIADEENTGYIARVDLSNLKLDQALLVRKVLTAGASLGLVKHLESDANQYLIRTELFEHLSAVRAREVRLGNLGSKPAVPEYAEEGEETLREVRVKIVEPEPVDIAKIERPLIEDMSSGRRLLEVDETRRQYISEICSRLHLDQVDEQFLEIMIAEYRRLDGAILKLRRIEAQIDTHLSKRENEFSEQVEAAHEKLMKKWMDDEETQRQTSMFNHQDIRNAIIVGEILPLLRDDLRRGLDDAQMRTPENREEEDYLDRLEKSHRAIDVFLDSHGQEVSVDDVIGELESFRSMKRSY